MSAADHKVQIIIAIISLLGVVAGSLFANWDKVFKQEEVVVKDDPAPVIASPPKPAPVPTGKPAPIGSYTKTCKDCRFVDDEKFGCYCRKTDGTWRWDDYNLAFCKKRVLKNKNGRLRCD